MSQPNEQIVFASGYAAAGQPGIRAFAYDAPTGVLRAIGACDAVTNPSFIVPHPHGRWLYAVSETAAADGMPGSVWALRYTIDGGAVRFDVINRQPARGDVTCHALFDASLRWLSVANYGSGSATVLPVQADGALGAPAGHAQHSGHGPNTARQEGPHAHSTIIAPGNRFVIVADLGIDRLMIYRLDASTGALEAHGKAAMRPGAGPRHMAFHPGGRVLYATHELDSTLGVYAWDGEAGTLRALQNLALLPAAAPENLASHVVVHGGRVYAANRGHNSLAVFDSAADGQLSRAAIVDCGGNWPRHFAIAPDGRFVIVANQYSGALDVLPLAGGLPGARVATVPFAQAACVQFAPR